MRRIEPYSLWLGTVVDAWDLKMVLGHGIEAIVDLAANEAPIKLTRDLIYCRFPVVDGVGNHALPLKMAIDTLRSLLEAQTPCLVYCSAGMSRSPVIAAAAIARLTGQPFADCLAHITAGHAHDVGPGLVCDVRELLGREGVV